MFAISFNFRLKIQKFTMLIKVDVTLLREKLRFNCDSPIFDMHQIAISIIK